MLSQLAAQIESIALAQVKSKSAAAEDGEQADEGAAAQTETTAEGTADAGASAELKPGDGLQAGAADEATQGLMDIAKQLVNMADQLPSIKQCMADVKAGIYKPSNGAIIAAGGTLPPKIDTTTG